MQQTRTFDEIPEDEFLPGKAYNDGEHTIWIEQHSNPRARKRKRYREKDIEVDPTKLDDLLDAGKKKKNSPAQDFPEDDEYAEYLIQNAPVLPQKSSNEETLADVQNTLKNAKQTLKMTPRALFDVLYDSYAKLKWKKKRRLLISAFLPYHQAYKDTVEFVEQNMERRKHNKGSRYLRAFRKCTMNRFNYFVTFTYDGKKMSVDEFKTKLKDYLSNKVKRDGWKYLGVWEGWDGSVRLHFHALIYIPDGTMPGELLTERSYNTSKHKMKTTTYNTEFNEKFGRSDVEEIIMYIADRAYNYVLKYLDKGGKLMVSKNCPGYVTGYMQKSQMICQMTSNEHKYVAAPQSQIVTLNGEIITLDEREPQKCLPNATTCN